MVDLLAHTGLPAESNPWRLRQRCGPAGGWLTAHARGGDRLGPLRRQPAWAVRSDSLPAWAHGRESNSAAGGEPCVSWGAPDPRPAALRRRTDLRPRLFCACGLQCVSPPRPHACTPACSQTPSPACSAMPHNASHVRCLLPSGHFTGSVRAETAANLHRHQGRDRAEPGDHHGRGHRRGRPVAAAEQPARRVRADPGLPAGAHVHAGAAAGRSYRRARAPEPGVRKEVPMLVFSDAL